MNKTTHTNLHRQWVLDDMESGAIDDIKADYDDDHYFAHISMAANKLFVRTEDGWTTRRPHQSLG